MTKAESTEPQSKPTTAELAQAERSARRFWVSLVVGMLGLQVLIGVMSIVLSVGDPSVAVVPNYHQAALDWEVTQRARALTQKLGWQINSSVSQVLPGSNKRVIRVDIKDVNGQPVRDLSVAAEAYHHARGTEVYQLQLQETDSGAYQASIGLQESGLWQLKLQIEGNHGIARDNRELIVR